MCVSSARERSFEDRFALLIRGEVGKKPILKKMVFYPHGTLVHFGSKKWRAQCCRHASPHRTPDWQAAPRAHFLIDQGGFFLRPRLGPFLKFMNSSIGGGTSGVPEIQPGKDGFGKKRHFTCTERMLILPIFLVGVHQWNSERAASRLFRGGARQG